MSAGGDPLPSRTFAGKLNGEQVFRDILHRSDDVTDVAFEVDDGTLQVTGNVEVRDSFELVPLVLQVLAYGPRGELLAGFERSLMIPTADIQQIRLDLSEKWPFPVPHLSLIHI